MPDEQKNLLLTVAYKRSRSFTTAMTALRFLVEYGPMCNERGETPTIEEYAEYVGCSRSQAFRRQAAFRKCFPNDDILRLWLIVWPLLHKSPFAHETPLAQAVFVGTIKATHS